MDALSADALSALTRIAKRANPNGLARRELRLISEMPLIHKTQQKARLGGGLVFPAKG